MEPDDPKLIMELSSAIKHEALPFLSRVESLPDFVEVAASLQKPQDLYTQQAIAYASVCAGDAERAKDLLGQFLHLLDTKIPWQREMADRTGTLLSKLAVNPIDAQQQLEVWEVETIQSLGLEAK